MKEELSIWPLGGASDVSMGLYTEVEGKTPYITSFLVSEKGCFQNSLHQDFGFPNDLILFLN